MAKVEFTSLAIADIEEIATFISHDSVHYANLLVAKIFSKTELLENHPHIGRIVPELNIKSVREVFEGNYRVIYKIVNKDTIHILTVHYSKKLLKRAGLKRIIKSGK